MAPSAASPVVVAVIDEAACIGCTFCAPACPVDAIVGAPRLMHTVIAAECTGCRLCLPPCPVDCIRMVDTGETLTHEQRKQRAKQYRRRHAARLTRVERELAGQEKADPGKAAARKKQDAIELAMQRARARLQRNR